MVLTSNIAIKRICFKAWIGCKLSWHILWQINRISQQFIILFLKNPWHFHWDYVCLWQQKISEVSLWLNQCLMRLIVAVEQRVFGDVRPVSIDIFWGIMTLKKFNVHLAGIELRAREFWFFRVSRPFSIHCSQPAI